jgi:hypothetical protein
MVFNKYQSNIPEDLPEKVRDELIEYIETIPFIKHLVSSESQRGYAKDKIRYSSLDDSDETKTYDDDRIIVDITKPHILEDLDFFRERAIFYEKNNRYTNITPNPNPRSEYALFWKEECRRWKEGLVRPIDGEWIPGYLYFYWNYSKIWLVEENANNNQNKRRQKSERKKDFPKPWLGDYLFYHYVDQARQEGQHGKLLKTRGCGWSFKAGAISPCNMYIFPGSGNVNFHLASEKTFLLGDKGMFGKVIDNLDWIADNTPLPRIRLTNSLRSMEVQLGYVDKFGNRKGLLSSVNAISLKDNPEKARGIRGPFIQYEEDGLFPDLETAWGVNREAVESGSSSFGFMMAGGCLTENNQVWDGLGNLVSIKDLNIKNNILGFNEKDGIISQENITYWQPPTNKECLRIETNTGRFIECSLDHPILYSHKSLKKMKELGYVNGVRKRQSLKKIEFKKAGLLQLNDQVATIEEVPIFSNKKMWEPRVVGWLIGDGSYGINKTPVLANCESEINNYLHYNLSEDVITEKTYVTKLNKTYEENRIKGICKKLRDIGIYGQTCNRKTLPVNIHSYSYKTITELIGGFFDTDGYISKNGVISLSCAYKNLLLEMQLLLQKLGIHGNINFKKPNLNNIKSKNGHYELEIKDKDSVLNFVKHISLYPKEKQTRLNSFKELYKNKKSGKASHLKGICFEKIIKIENIGSQPVYNLTAGKTNTYIGNGIITHNTGGTEGASFEGSKKLFYNPDAYNIYSVENVYDKNVQSSNKCGFFWGAYMNRHRCYDMESGEPDVIKALIEIIENRHKIAKNASDPAALTQARAEKPITPQEAIMRVEGTIFPVADLVDYLNSIKPEEQRFLSQHYVGELVHDQVEGVKWIPNADLRPIRTNDPGKNRIGAVEIFELPKRGADNRIQTGRYIGGIDPIDADDGTSLFSIQIMDMLTDRIVAEYTGRYPKAEQCYEIALKLSIFYNAQINYENNLKGLHTYFKHKNALHYLADTPEILKDMDMLKPSMSNPKGTRATKPVNAWGRQLQVSWMLSEAYHVDGETKKLNLHTIRSLGYLEECIVWNADGNFDRVSAMGMLFILREDRLRQQQSLRKQEVKTKNSWTDSKFFEKLYGNKSISSQEKYKTIFND